MLPLPSKPYPPPPYSTSLSPLSSFHTPPYTPIPYPRFPPILSPSKNACASLTHPHQPTHIPPSPFPTIYTSSHLSSTPLHTPQLITTHIFALMNRYGLGRAIPRSGFARASRIENRPPPATAGHIPSLSEAFRLCHW